ncbi:MAG: 2-oxoacid:acceptor oxidoreductase subunit alpha, partial [Methanomassiliicoccales archaeon]
EVVPGGGIVVDSRQLKTKILEIPALPPEFRSNFSQFMERNGIGETLQDLLDYASRMGIHVFPVVYTDLLYQVADSLSLEKTAKLNRMINVVTVGLSFGILGYDINAVKKALVSIFSEKSKLIEMNMRALEMAYNHAQENFRNFVPPLKVKESVKEERLLLSGNQAVAIGKALGGCRVQTYYPITPAADESEFIEAHEILETKESGVNAGVVVVQTEDEIAAVNMASGAALTGVRAATSTSGPGFSLMVEGLSWAGMNEVPLVITYYQRGAPSTGLPTRHGQDDLRFAIHGGHGEFPRIVLASGDISECFYDAVNAFNYAEMFQLPVIHLIDKALANSFQTLKVFDTKQIRINRGSVVSEEMLSKGSYKRFAFNETGVSPRAYLGMKGGVHWYTGDEHNELGHISEEPLNRTLMMEKRMKKLNTVLKEIPSSEKINYFGKAGAENIIVSWGSPKGAIVEAVGELIKEGFNIGFLQVRLVHPLPVNEIVEIMGNAKHVIDIEMNYSGQLGGIIREKTGILHDYEIVKFNGRPMTVTEVYDAVKFVLVGKAPKRQVLTHGA